MDGIFLRNNNNKDGNRNERTDMSSMEGINNFGDHGELPMMQPHFPRASKLATMTAFPQQLHQFYTQSTNAPLRVENKAGGSTAATMIPPPQSLFPQPWDAWPSLGVVSGATLLAMKQQQLMQQQQQQLMMMMMMASQQSNVANESTTGYLAGAVGGTTQGVAGGPPPFMLPPPAVGASSQTATAARGMMGNKISDDMVTTSRILDNHAAEDMTSSPQVTPFHNNGIQHHNPQQNGLLRQHVAAANRETQLLSSTLQREQQKLNELLSQLDRVRNHSDDDACRRQPQQNVHSSSPPSASTYVATEGNRAGGEAIGMMRRDQQQQTLPIEFRNNSNPSAVSNGIISCRNINNNSIRMHDNSDKTVVGQMTSVESRQEQLESIEEQNNNHTKSITLETMNRSSHMSEESIGEDSTNHQRLPPPSKAEYHLFQQLEPPENTLDRDFLKSESSSLKTSSPVPSFTTDGGGGIVGGDCGDCGTLNRKRRRETKMRWGWQQFVLNGGSEERGDGRGRRKVQMQIERYLKSLISPSEGSSGPNKDLVKLAFKLDEFLYECAPSFDEYRNPATIESRLKILAMQVGRRVEARSAKKRRTKAAVQDGLNGLAEYQTENPPKRTRRSGRLSRRNTQTRGLHAQPVSSSNASNGSSGAGDCATHRQSVLRSRLGPQRYDEMMALVSDVKLIRRTSSAWMYSQAVSQHQNVESARCTVEGSRESRENADEEENLLELIDVTDTEKENYEEDKAMKAAVSVPSALSSIYFRTRLVDAVLALLAPTLSPQMWRVDSVNWAELMREARSNIAAFREFEKSVDKGSRGKIFPSCRRAQV